MYTYTDVKNKVEEEIKKLHIPLQPAGLYEPVKYILSLGGKRFRPCLSLLCANLFTEDISAAVPPALALEVFHNFTLLHDDIMDNANMRRGHATVHEKWNVNTAILSGDVMLVRAYQLLAQVPEKVLPDVLQMFSKTSAEVCEGQQMDMGFEKRDEVTEAEYIQMIELKTAVLLGCSAYIGARVAGAENKDAEHLYQFGKNLGISFQIQDDLLDAYGEAKKFGKKPGGDILQNKKTFLWVALMQCLHKEERKTFAETIQRLQGDEKIKYVLSAYEKYNSGKIAQEAVKKYFNVAMRNLELLETNSERKHILSELASNMYERKF